jgi:hypothetical protein
MYNNIVWSDKREGFSYKSARVESKFSYTEIDKVLHSFAGIPFQVSAA